MVESNHEKLQEIDEFACEIDRSLLGATRFRNSHLSDTSPTATTKPAQDWQVEIFYDADCPLCVREIAMLRWMDRRDRVRFTDIAADEFNPSQFGKTQQQFMDEIQGRLPDGTWIIGVEVFRRVYSAVGFGILVWPTRLPLVRNLLDWVYKIFARNRLRLTGRCNQQSCGTQKTELADKKIIE